MASHNQNGNGGERQPLLRQHEQGEEGEEGVQTIGFEKDDPDNPRNWSPRTKYANTAVIALMAVLSPLVSSVFTPAISQIGEEFDATNEAVVGAATGYVIMLGVGPLIIAPLSETFGRRPLYIICFSIFTLLQIPTALSPNLAGLIVVRTLAGGFGSVGIANGGGTLNDLFDPSERATVFGWYLLGPLLGPTLGPLIGGVISQYLEWRWMFAILAILCAVNTTIGYFLLHETFAPKILSQRCRRLEKENGGRYTYEGEDTRRLTTKILHNLKRPVRILFTAIVFPTATYQALVFAIMYTVYTNMESIFGPDSVYALSTIQTSLLYLGFGLGFLIAIRGLVPRVDTIYNKLGKEHPPARPEYRLPLANVGAVLLPITLFWFGWTREFELHYMVVILAAPFLGIAQVAIMNCVQNYYIDSFSDYAASAIAAGALFRSLVGGVVPLAGPAIFRQFGYGWGWSIFGFISIAMAPMPALFMKYGQHIREKAHVEL